MLIADERLLRSFYLDSKFIVFFFFFLQWVMIRVATRGYMRKDLGLVVDEVGIDSDVKAHQR